MIKILKRFTTLVETNWLKAECHRVGKLESSGRGTFIADFDLFMESTTLYFTVNALSYLFAGHDSIASAAYVKILLCVAEFFLHIVISGVWGLYFV